MSSKKLFIPFFSAGYPELSLTSQLIEFFDNHHADYIEVGLPHSDALADGETIQNSSQIALQNGMNIELLLEQVQNTSVNNSKLILFSYYNPIYRYGLDKTFEAWSKAGGKCILIPDIPLEEAPLILSLCQKYNLQLIFLLAPNTTKERMQKIIELSEEFLCLVSYTGVTGSNNTNNNYSLDNLIKEVKQQKPNLPIVIGFGINDAQKAQRAINLGADGIVIGSTIVKLIAQDCSLKDLDNFVQEIKEVL